MKEIFEMPNLSVWQNNDDSFWLSMNESHPNVALTLETIDALQKALTETRRLVALAESKKMGLP